MYFQSIISMPRAIANSKGTCVQIKKKNCALSPGWVSPLVKSHDLVRGALSVALPGSGPVCYLVHTQSRSN